MSGRLVPEFLFLGFFVMGEFNRKALLFDREPAGVDLSPAQRQDEQTEMAKVAQLFVQVRIGRRKRAGGGGVTDRDPAGKFLRQVRGKNALQRRIIGLKSRSEFKGFLARLPVAEAVTVIFREILLADGNAIEVGL